MCVALSIVPQVGQGLCSPPPTTYHYLGELFALPRDNSKGRSEVHPLYPLGVPHVKDEHDGDHKDWPTN